MSWKGAKRGWNELMHPPKHEIAPEERKQRAQRHELGFPLFLLSQADRAEAKKDRQAEQKRDQVE